MTLNLELIQLSCLGLTSFLAKELAILSVLEQCRWVFFQIKHSVVFKQYAALSISRFTQQVQTGLQQRVDVVLPQTIFGDKKLFRGSRDLNQRFCNHLESFFLSNWVNIFVQISSNGFQSPRPILLLKTALSTFFVAQMQLFSGRFFQEILLWLTALAVKISFVNILTFSRKWKSYLHALASPSISTSTYVLSFKHQNRGHS